MLNNWHYVSDVVVGAAVGILTAELAYWGLTCKVWGARFSRKSMWAELLILIRTSVTHSLLVKESIYITSITPA